MKRFALLRDLIAPARSPPETPVRWRILGRTFLKLGATGFGGGIAVIAQLRRIVVRERHWLSDEEFLDAVSLAQSLPGANAAVVGLIAAAAVRLGKTAMSRQWHVELRIATAFVLIFMGASVAEVVLLAGMFGIFVQSFKVREWHCMRQQLHKQRQSGGRTAVATLQARKQAAEAGRRDAQECTVAMQMTDSLKAGLDAWRERCCRTIGTGA